MKCLLMCGEYDDDIASVCGFCHTDVDTIDYEDYVKQNIVLWCPNCGEVLLCCGALHEENSFRELDNSNGHPSNCIQEITHQEALKIESNSSLVKELLPCNGWKYFLVGVMEISHTLTQHELNESDSEDYENDENNIPSIDLMNKLKTPIMKLKESEFDTDHGGSYLWYQADCSECKRRCTSVIWGC